jgi:hypothetical protein
MALPLAVVLGLTCAVASFGAAGSTPVDQAAPTARRLSLIAIDPGAEAGVTAALERAGAVVVAHLGPRRWLIAVHQDVEADVAVRAVERVGPGTDGH